MKIQMIFFRRFLLKFELRFLHSGGESQLFTWIYRIATNISLNYLRKQKVRAILSFTPIDAAAERKLDDDPYFNGDEVQKVLSVEKVAKLYVSEERFRRQQIHKLCEKPQK